MRVGKMKKYWFGVSIFNWYSFCFLAVTAILSSVTAFAQTPPYDQFPDAEPPYYRVRYDASTNEGELAFGVNYTVWIPENAETVRGVIVHQHGCGEGSCKSGLSGAFDLHWQALAEKHRCALLSPAYEQPADANCQLWCDPRNGSSASFKQALIDLGKMSQHPELATVPWALWGHSGGGHWAGGMVLLHPEQVAAAWLRSGVPLFEGNPDRPEIKPYDLPDQALHVPMMCNPGTQEGVTIKEGRFARVWPANEVFFEKIRARGGLIGVAVDPLTSHECGNQRYLAIRWIDQCLDLRLPKESGGSLQRIDQGQAWLAATPGFLARPAAGYTDDPKLSTWLPSEKFAKLWMQYVKDTQVEDLTNPPSPYAIKIASGVLTWSAKADVESGIEKFLVYQGDELIAEVKSDSINRFGRPVFQGLLYSDTPTLPLNLMRYTLPNNEKDLGSRYRVVTVNTVGQHSEPSVEVVRDRSR